MLFKKAGGGGAVSSEVFSHVGFHGNSALISDPCEVFEKGVDPGNIGVGFWKRASVGIGELDSADQVGGFAQDVAAFAFHGEVKEVGGEANFRPVHLAGDGEGFPKGVEKIGLGVVDVFDGNAEPRLFS